MPAEGCCDIVGFTDVIDDSGVDESDDEAEIVLFASPVIINDEGGEFAPGLMFCSVAKVGRKPFSLGGTAVRGAVSAGVAPISASDSEPWSCACG